MQRLRHCEKPEKCSWAVARHNTSISWGFHIEQRAWLNINCDIVHFPHPSHDLSAPLVFFFLAPRKDKTRHVSVFEQPRLQTVKDSLDFFPPPSSPSPSSSLVAWRPSLHCHHEAHLIQVPVLRVCHAPPAQSSNQQQRNKCFGCNSCGRDKNESMLGLKFSQTVFWVLQAFMVDSTRSLPLEHHFAENVLCFTPPWRQSFNVAVNPSVLANVAVPFFFCLFGGMVKLWSMHATNKQSLAFRMRSVKNYEDMLLAKASFVCAFDGCKKHAIRHMAQKLNCFRNFQKQEFFCPKLKTCSHWHHFGSGHWF